MTKGDGLPCKKCRTSAWDKRGNCKECSNERVKKWQRENPEKTKEWQRGWEKENPDKKSRKYRRWYESQKKEAIERASNWKKENPEKNTASENRRRTRKTEAGGSYTAEEFKQLCEQYDNRCLACGKRKELTADHVIPISGGGTSDISNIQPLCKSCNSSKGNRHTTDYRTKPGIERSIQKTLFD
jgi:5-methylcytosine-specific restriction endonuclease McrA